jgi:hypothetical protein
VTEPAKPALAPAGIVKSPEVDGVLEQVELSLEAQDFRNRFLEGEELQRDETERRFRELKALASAVNIRLADLGVRIVGAQPENVGRGARFHGTDAQNREYVIDLHLDDEDRMRDRDFDAQLDGLDTVNLIERAVRARHAEYLENERLERLGLLRGKPKGKRLN